MGKQPIQKQVMITKASGESELFSDKKLRRSLERVHASSENIDKIITHVRLELKPGMETAQIYKHAFSLLRKHERTTAARYSLKEAVRELGPDGHPFEKLVGALFEAEGFSVQVGKIVRGICVSHEIDVIAQKNKRHLMVECKFHNRPGIKSDVKVSLYIQARFQDVKKAWKQNPGHDKKFHEAWLITNTKLTSDAISYAECVGMKPVSWDYPSNASLSLRIDRAGVHPITCLTTLTTIQKKQLINDNIILCKNLCDNNKSLYSLGLTAKQIIKVLQEAKELCKEIK